MYVQNKRNVLLLSVGSVQWNLHGLLSEAHFVLAEEVCLHLVVENCMTGQKNTQLQTHRPPKAASLTKPTELLQFSFLHTAITHASFCTAWIKCSKTAFILPVWPLIPLIFLLTPGSHTHAKHAHPKQLINWGLLLTEACAWSVISLNPVRLFYSSQSVSFASNEPCHFSSQIITFVRHHFTSLEVHRGATGRADLVDVVAERVAAVLPAAQAHPLVEGVFGVAAVGHALLLVVEQGVDEQVDGALVGTFDELVHVCNAHRAKRALKPLQHYSDDIMQSSTMTSWCYMNCISLDDHRAFLT